MYVSLKQTLGDGERYVTRASLRASSPFGSHARFILGEIYLDLARDLGASRERIGAGAR